MAARPRDGVRRALAYALAAAVLLAVATPFPFLAFSASGLEQVMTLPQTATTLYADGSWLLAVLVAGFVVILPGLLALALIVLLTPLLYGGAQSRLRPLARFVFGVEPWSMVEVFLIGVLVSFVKIAAMATVLLGASFWAFVGFAICLTAARASLDRRTVWAAIDPERSA